MNLTEEELKQYRYLLKDAEHINRKLKDLRQELHHFDNYHSLSYSNAPKVKKKNKNQYNRLHYLLDSISILQLDYQLKLIQVNRQLKKIENYIDSINDGIIRNIYRLKFVSGKRWYEISEEMNYSEIHVKRIYYSHYNKNDTK